MRQLNFVLLTLIFLLPPLTIRQNAKELRRPIALDKIDGGDLFALDASGAVLRLKASGQTLTLSGSFSLSTIVSSAPTDLVSAKLFGQPTLLVTTNNQRSGFLSQYSLEGALQNTWTFRSSVVGLDVDYNSHIVYVAAYNTPEIYSVNLQAPNAQAQQQRLGPAFVGSVLGARHLGPLAVDLTRSCLYLGDVETGQVFQFDIKTHKSRVIARHFSSPQALLLSSDSSSLYIADAQGRKVYILNLTQANATPKIFSALAQFRSPAGLAKLEDGRVVVADDRTGVIFILSQNGTVQSTIAL